MALPPLLLLLLAAAAAGVRLQPPPWGMDGRRLRWAAGAPCPYVEQPYRAVKRALEAGIVGQAAAVRQVLDAVAAWEDDHRRGRDRPLVLTLTGPTGVGKTETANLIARALLAASYRDPDSGRDTPDGEVVIDGSQYTETGDAPAPDGGEGGGAPGPGLLALQQRLRDTLAQGLYSCHGQAVIVFDEAQKMVRRALDVLTPLMQPNAPLLRYFEDPASDALPRVLSSARAVIIVISDVGQAQIDRFIMRAAAAAAAAAGGDGLQLSSPPSSASATQQQQQQQQQQQMLLRALAVSMRASLAEDWGSAGLGALSHAVVPFMPFNQSGARALLAHALGALVAGVPPRGMDRLVLRAADVAAALADPSALLSFALVGGGAGGGGGDGGGASGGSGSGEGDPLAAGGDPGGGGSGGGGGVASVSAMGESTVAAPPAASRRRPRGGGGLRSLCLEGDLPSSAGGGGGDAGGAGQPASQQQQQQQQQQQPVDACRCTLPPTAVSAAGARSITLQGDSPLGAFLSRLRHVLEEHSEQQQQEAGAAESGEWGAGTPHGAGVGGGQRQQTPGSPPTSLATTRRVLLGAALEAEYQGIVAGSGSRSGPPPQPRRFDWGPHSAGAQPAAGARLARAVHSASRLVHRSGARLGRLVRDAVGRGLGGGGAGRAAAAEPHQQQQAAGHAPHAHGGGAGPWCDGIDGDVAGGVDEGEESASGGGRRRGGGACPPPHPHHDGSDGGAGEGRVRRSSVVVKVGVDCGAARGGGGGAPPLRGLGSSHRFRIHRCVVTEVPPEAVRGDDAGGGGAGGGDGSDEPRRQLVEEVCALLYEGGL